MSSAAKNRIVYTIISILILVTLMFVPVLGSGGLFPSEKLNYFESVETFFEYPGEIISSPVEGFVYLVMIFFTLLWIVHFTAAMTGSKGAFLVVSIICTVLWAAPIVLFLTKYDDLSALFDTKYGGYAIGMYVILLLFIVSIIVAAVSKSKKAEQPRYNPYGAQGYAPPYGGQYQNPQQPYGQPYGQPVQQPYGQPYQPPVQQPVEPAYQPPVQQPVEPAYQPPVEQPVEPAYQPPVEQPAEQFVPEEAPQAPQEEAPQETAKFCPVCGAPIDDSPFCGNCGTRL